MSAPSKVIGIDPGRAGAIAMLEDGQFKAVHDMPLVIDSDGNKTICAHEVACMLRDYRPELVVIELVNAMPSAPGKDGKRRRMGGQSMFNFGRGFGLVEAAAAIQQFRIVYVRPAAWMRRCGLINANKDTHRERAADLFPQAAYELRLKKHDGRADALLIARFGHAHQEEHPGERAPVNTPERLPCPTSTSC